MRAKRQITLTALTAAFLALGAACSVDPPTGPAISDIERLTPTDTSEMIPPVPPITMP